MCVTRLKRSGSEALLCKSASVICLACVIGCDGNRLRIDRKGSDIGYYTIIVSGCVGCAVLNSIKISVVVCSVIAYVRYACCGRCDGNDVAICKCEYLAGAVCCYRISVVCHCVRLILMELSVISPASCCGCNDDRALIHSNGECTICSGYNIVTYFSSDSCRYLYSVNRCDHVRLCAFICDRAVSCHHNREGMCVARLKCCCIELWLCKRCSVICLICILGSDSHCLRIYCKGSVYSGNHVVAHCGRSSRCHCHSVDCRDHVRLCAYVCDRAVRSHRYCEGVCIACLQCCCSESALCQCTSVICLAGIICGNGNSLRVDPKRSVRSSYKIVAHCRLCARLYCNSVNRSDHIRLCAYVCDRAGLCHCYCKSMTVACLKCSCSESAFCKSASIIDLICIICSDRYPLGVDGQSSRCISNSIIGRNSCGSCLILSRAF